MTPSCADALKLRRASIILERCAVIAKCIQQLTSDAPDEGTDTFVCIELLAAQLGFLVDLAREVAGYSACFGGAGDWMLPATYATADDGET